MSVVRDPDTGQVVHTSPQRPVDHNPATLALCHEQIDRLCSALDDALPNLEALTTAAANAEADWQKARNTRLVLLASDQAGKSRSERMTVGIMDATADLACESEHRAHLLADKVLRSHREYLHTLRSQLSAQQTIARALGGLT